MRRIIQHGRDDQGVGTIFLVLAIVPVLIGAALAIDVTRFSQENSSAQHSADATALAVATDCVLTGGTAQPEEAYDSYRKMPLQTISPDTPLVCGPNEVRVIIDKNVSGGLFLNRDARIIHREAIVGWGTVSSANTVPITIASCEFTPEMLDGVDGEDDIFLYLDHPSPDSGCSGGPGGFGSLTDTGDDDDCLTVSVVNDVAVGATGESDHAGQCFAEQFGTILNDGGFVDVFVPIYGAYTHTPPDYNYTIVGYAAFRMRGYEFNGSHGDAGTLDGGNKCPDPEHWPGDERCLHGDFVRIVAPGDAILGPSQENTGARQVFLSK